MRKRVRELGLNIGNMKTGPANQITDVTGVKVGHVTLKHEMDLDTVVRTGVTAVLPHEGNPFFEKVPAASFVLNGYGKTTGLVQVEELGVLESPIMLTSTFHVGDIWQGTLDYMMEQAPEIGDTTSSLNIVVGECNDSYLHTVRANAIQKHHAGEAINMASKKVEEGAVGAGCGMMCYGYKGGIGTSSRVTEMENFTIGVLVLSNFGKRNELQLVRYQAPGFDESEVPDGSIMIIVATDAPMTSRQLKRLARRATFGLARTGSHIHNGSGDIVIAFSNGFTVSHQFSGAYVEPRNMIRDDHPLMNQLFQGAIEATEEAILNSLTMAETTSGRKGRKGEELPYHLFQLQ
ncbi:D-aminopeptidase [Melghiribacillus thermohalophilus]|uniref:D-aminopeptidase n=1 Tax=Melghiribacillus thermohalophilus TaxID=1324956 RepID=A0A4R3MW75_9BACI|nr:P1 family peptidase [Melghiribacillus thermohalophilus]TCT19997.1 D-aminopeptidase [Melghiribacillus thermohalophilus]